MFSFLLGTVVGFLAGFLVSGSLCFFQFLKLVSNK